LANPELPFKILSPVTRIDNKMDLNDFLGPNPIVIDLQAENRWEPFLHSTLSPQLSTVIMPPLANLAKLLHQGDFGDGNPGI